MNKLYTILLSLLIGHFFFACIEADETPGFENTFDNSIYSYLLEKEDTFSSFLSIINAGGLNLTLSAYNPNGLNYTLFLPTNDAVDRFVESNNSFLTLDELISDTEYAREIVKFHVLNVNVYSKNFPIGGFSEPTLSNDILTVNVRFEEESAYYTINDLAPVIETDIETSNGIIHILNEMLSPLTYTTADWLNGNLEYSIFNQALIETGLDQLFILAEENGKSYTLFLEHDTIFEKRNIHSFVELKNAISPNDTNYTSFENPLYQFVAYHILNDSYFLDYFENRSANYSTVSNNPLGINGLGIDIRINLGKSILDTIIVGVDTTFIDFVGVIYDESNLQTKNGAIHFVNYVMMPEAASRAVGTYQFLEEPYIKEIRKEPNSYLIEDTSALKFIRWKGSELVYVQSDDAAEQAWGDDYIVLDGDFEITYQIPQIVPGKYEAFINVNSLNQKNAIIEVFIDGIKMGSLYDLSKGGKINNPYVKISLGNVNFQSYRTHQIKIKSLIPGRFQWDYVRFEPIN